MNKQRVILSVVVLAALCFVLIGATESRKVPTPQTQSTTAQTTNVHGLVFGLRPTGFDPPRVQVAQGTYLLIAQNRSGIRDLTFRVSVEGGAVLHEVHDQRLQWKKLIQLQPGTYVISVVDHPNWQCVITVTSN